MATQLYGKAKESLLTSQINWMTDDIRCSLVDIINYTVNIDVDQFYSDINPVAIVAESSALTNKSVTVGAADADDVEYLAISGPSAEAIVIWKDTGTPSTSNLIAYIDIASGLPITPNGGDITITWDNGANKIFKL